MTDPTEPKSPWTDKLSFDPFLALLALFSAILGAILIILSLRYTNLIKKSLIPQFLTIVSTSPADKSQNLSQYTKIAINFNLPVSVDHVESYITISPHVEGKFIQGDSPNQIIFTPSSPFPAGSLVQVQLLAGLPSDAGKKLFSSKTLNFYISQNAGNITVTSNGMSGKFLSFARSNGANLNINVGSDIDNPLLRIYKADDQTLAKSLLYNPTTSSGLYGEYLENPIDTSKLELVSQHSNLRENPDLKFENETGLYLFQSLDGKTVLNNTWVALNATGVHFRQDDQNLYLASQNIDTNQPESDIDITLYRLGNTPEILGKHTISDISKIPFNIKDRLDLIVGKKGSEYIVIPVAIPNSQADIKARRNLSTSNQLFIYTDRPVYTPGSKVSFRGIIRKDNDALYALPDTKKVRVYIPNYSTNPTSYYTDTLVDIKNGGIFSGEFTLPKNAKQETHYLFVTTDTDKTDKYDDFNTDSTYFDILAYSKPAYGLDINIDKSEITQGDTIVAKIKGSYFDGKPLSNQEITFSTYRRDYYETEKAAYNSSFNLNGWGGMCGGGIGFDEEYYGEPLDKSRPVKLDDNGEATVKINPSNLDKETSQEITLLVEKTDDKNNRIVAAKNAIIHQGEFNIFIRPGPTQAQSGKNTITTFYAENRDGQKLANHEFTYQLLSSTYTEGKYKETVYKNGHVSTDNDGIGTLSQVIDTSSDQSFILRLSSPDTRGNTVKTQKYLYVYSTSLPQYYQKYSGNAVSLQISTRQTNLTPGKSTTLEIESPADLTVFTTFERGRVHNPQWLHLKTGKNTFTFDVPDDYVPSITPTFSFFLGGEYHFEGLSLNVPALSKVINVEVSTDKPHYAPGDTAIVTIITKDSSGNLIPAKVGVDIVDKAIFAIRKNATPALHSSFYYFRNRSTNASSSLTWILSLFGGGGGGGGGPDLTHKDADTLYWNPDLSTGTDGQLTINVPVGPTQTTWKIMTLVSTDDTKLGQGELDFLVSK